ncbi:MAG TPA: type VI secretion system tube protein Hcp [Burkholderiaceae bacterium]|jgi:type VI secretion system Hcp family effector
MSAIPAKRDVGGRPAADIPLIVSDIYIDFNAAGIRGDGCDPEHPGAVAITSFAQRILASDSVGADSERVEFGDLIFTKETDAATPALVAACESRLIVAQIEVHFYRSGSGKAGAPIRHKVYALDLRDCIVSSVVRADPADGDSFETFTLKPAAMNWRYEHPWRALSAAFDASIVGAGVSGLKYMTRRAAPARKSAR